MRTGRTTVTVFRLKPQNNQPHEWQWEVSTGNGGAIGGIAKTKKEALKAVQETLESLKSE